MTKSGMVKQAVETRISKGLATPTVTVPGCSVSKISWDLYVRLNGLLARAMKCGTVTDVGRSVFLGVSHATPLAW